MKAPLRVVVHLVPRPAGVGIDNTLAALARMGAQIRKQESRQRRKAGAA